MSTSLPSAGARRSVARVLVTSRAPRVYQPWERKYQESATASACVVDGERLLTCAHVVAHAVQLHVTKPGDARRYQARVVAVGHDSELALLEVDDRSFFDELEGATVTATWLDR